MNAVRRPIPRGPVRAAAARGCPRGLTAAFLFIAVWPAAASAESLLREARVRIAMIDPVTCLVTASIAVTLEGGGDIELQLQRLEGSRVELLEVSGAGTARSQRTMGATEALSVEFPGAGTHRYELRYRVVHPDRWAYRCPLWLPPVAGDGYSRDVELEVSLPPGARPAGGSFPAFDWDEGSSGRATLGNLPAFVNVPFIVPGEARQPARDIGRLMDLTAMGVLLAGTAWWVARRRR